MSHPTITQPGSRLYAPAVLADHPIAYWRLGEASGTQAADASGNGNHATYIGPTLNVAGLLGGDSDGAVRFEGLLNSHKIQSQAEAPFDFTSDFTLEMWISDWQPGSGADPHDGLISKYAANQTGYDLMVQKSTGLLRMAVRGTSNIDTAYKAGTSLAGGGTHHVVVVCTPTRITFYIDGAGLSPTTGTWTPVTNDAPIILGVRGAGFSGPLRVVLDEVAIYDYALSPERIAHHYNVGLAAIASLSVGVPSITAGTAGVPTITGGAAYVPTISAQ